MAFTTTVVKKFPTGGGYYRVLGTFTSAGGDNSLSLANADHGLNNIADVIVKLDRGGLNTELPKIAISSGTITVTFDDTQAYAGNFDITGN